MGLISRTPCLTLGTFVSLIDLLNILEHVDGIHLGRQSSNCELSTPFFSRPHRSSQDTDGARLPRACKRKERRTCFCHVAHNLCLLGLQFFFWISCIRFVSTHSLAHRLPHIRSSGTGPATSQPSPHKHARNGLLLLLTPVLRHCRA